MKKGTVTFDKIKAVFDKDFDSIFDDIELLTNSIPTLVNITGLKAFLEHMDFTAPQYYRRVEKPDLWTRSEAKKAQQFFKKHKVFK